MVNRPYKRKLSSVWMTRQLHFRHMGLWVVLTIGLVLLLNICFYLFIQERWDKLNVPGTPDLEQYDLMRQSLVVSLVLGTGVFSLAIIALAMFTSHRIAGPYLRLKRAFVEVREGDLEHRLVFRRYDRLEFLADSFNEMMRTIRERVAKGPAGEGQKKSGHPPSGQE
jgi:methyl-accepting chemotaxis protein